MLPGLLIFAVPVDRPGVCVDCAVVVDRHPGPSYLMDMQFRCSRCHTSIDAQDDSEPESCPTCHAEAGLEPVKSLPFAMGLFGLVIGGALVATVVSTVIAVSG